jgi:hypothetical protein
METATKIMTAAIGDTITIAVQGRRPVTGEVVATGEMGPIICGPRGARFDVIQNAHNPARLTLISGSRSYRVTGVA